MSVNLADPAVIRIPRVQISFQDWQKMMAYVINCPTEINGFGLVEVRDDIIRVKDVFILDQVASPGHAEVDHDALTHFIHEMVLSGTGNPGSIKFQWHSHVNMESYFSPTDTANIERWPGDWLISLVVNKRGEFRCRLDIFEPFRVEIDVIPEIVTVFDEGLLDSTADEIRLKVRSQGVGFFGRLRTVPLEPRASADAVPYDPTNLQIER